MKLRASPSQEPTVAAARMPLLRASVNAVRGRPFGGSYSGEGWERHTAIVDTHPTGPRRKARLGSWVARCRKAIAQPLIALLQYPLGPSYSARNLSRIGHEKRRAHVREVARQICIETNQPIPEALLR